MDIKEEIFYFAQNYGSAFIVINYPSTQILYCNNIAKNLFDVGEDNSFDKLDLIFAKYKDVFKNTIEFVGKEFTLLENIVTVKADKTEQLCNVVIGYFNQEKTKLFIEVTPKLDTRLEQAIIQIEGSIKIEAIINLDENLSILHANTKFYEDFSTDAKFLADSFIAEEKEVLLREIFEASKNGLVFSKKVKLQDKWYLIDIQTRILDQSGQDKAIVYFTNMDKHVELEEEVSLLNQHFAIMQELSKDVLYQVKMPSQTLYHNLKGAFGGKFGDVIPDHVQTFIKEKIIHPEDVDKYLRQLREFISEHGQQNEIPIRVAVFNNEYKWYIFRGKKILDKNGQITFIYGALVDVDNEQKFQKKANSLNNYFEALQQVSGESFFSIDVKKKVLTQKGQLAEELNMLEPVDNFPESVLHAIHPDDLDVFKKHTYDSLKGIPGQFQMRALTKDNNYHWYELSSQIIRDEKGEVIEVVGKMNNIHDEKTIKAKFLNLNKYFDAMQAFSKDVLYRIDVETMTLYHSFKSERAEKIGNVIPDYVNTVVKLGIIHPEDAECYLKKTQEWFLDESVEMDIRMSLVTDEYEWYCIKGKKIFDENDNLVEVVGTLENVQAKHQYEEEYTNLNQYFTAIQELTSDRIFHIDVRNKIFQYIDSDDNNHSILYEDMNFIQKLVERGILFEEHVEYYKENFANILNGDNSEELKIQISVNSKPLEWHLVKTKVIKDEAGNLLEIFGKMENIQKQLELEEKVRFDKLTKAFSRDAFENSIIKELQKSTPGSCHALIFIDIDDFKYINDNFGHQFGDFVLQIFTNRMKNCIKSSDLIGRVGGDEFVIFLKGISNGETALERANLMVEKMARPVSNGQISHILGLSIGIAVTPDHGSDLETLYANADVAVYESKKKGKNRATLYSK